MCQRLKLYNPRWPRRFDNYLHKAMEAQTSLSNWSFQFPRNLELLLHLSTSSGSERLENSPHFLETAHIYPLRRGCRNADELVRPLGFRIIHKSAGEGVCRVPRDPTWVWVTGGLHRRLWWRHGSNYSWKTKASTPKDSSCAPVTQETKRPMPETQKRAKQR